MNSSRPVRCWMNDGICKFVFTFLSRNVGISRFYFFFDKLCDLYIIFFCIEYKIIESENYNKKKKWRENPLLSVVSQLLPT